MSREIARMGRLAKFRRCVGGGRRERAGRVRKLGSIGKQIVVGIWRKHIGELQVDRGGNVACNVSGSHLDVIQARLQRGETRPVGGAAGGELPLIVYIDYDLAYT